MVNETVFQNIVNVKKCIKYCQGSDTFNDELEDLPLCVTADGILRAFKHERPIYWSRYNSMVPESNHRFIHNDLYPLLTPSVSMHCLVCFDLQAFASVLPNTLAASKYKTQETVVPWNAENLNIPNKNWLENVWTYIDSVTVPSHLTAPPKPDESEKLLSPLLAWCLVPCRQSDSTKHEGHRFDVLFPVCKAKFVLDLQSFKGPIETALERLALPCLDENFISQPKSLLHTLVVSVENPQALLCYLHEYKNIIKTRTIRSKDCLAILEFIAQNLEEILEGTNEDDLLNMIKEVPLHVTISGQKLTWIQLLKF
ncbi:unnamed protein product [Mytilus edulis]|uniref:Uncharacterized protein n=1 Tax=Mytilus edulis TaxID=6550 RepID=A0A8S3V774_MYTED|nr:unnamed protein product [Mytilus edulis]